MKRDRRNVACGLLLCSFALLPCAARGQWVQTNGPGGGIINCFAISGANIYAGTEGGGVFLTTDTGAHWVAANDGLANTFVLSLAVSGANIFAGTNGSGVWRRPLADFGINAVNEQTSSLPAQFSLSQNYPNPFSLSTTITYTLPRATPVSLEVYNALGERVATLAKGEQSAGAHSVVFDARTLPAGVYVYRLIAGRFSQTGKMLLVY